jgi:MFS family permease
MNSEDGMLTDEQIEYGLQMMTWQGISTQVRLTLTESVFLVGFALALGAPNTLIGVLAAIPFIAQLLQIPSVYLIHKAGKRKRFNLITQIGNRFAVYGMAIIPFLVSLEYSLILLVLFVAIQAIFNGMGSPSWNSWLRDLVPQDRLGRFFSVRMTLTGMVAIVVSLIGGQFIGQWDVVYGSNDTGGYAILFFIAFIFGMIAIIFTIATPEPKMVLPEQRIRFSELVAKPFRDENFRKLMWFSAAWTFSTALASPFFTVYLLSDLSQNLPLVTSLVAFTSLVSILFFRFWGKLSDRFSNKSILQVSAPLYIIGTVMWTFASVAKVYSLLIPLLILIHFISGLASSGVNLASANIGLKLAPKGDSTAYLAARGSIIAVAGSIAPLVGGALGDILSRYTLSLTIIEDPSGIFPLYSIAGFSFVFILSAIFGLYALHKLSLVKETGEVEERIVLDAIFAETRRNVKTLSTVDGLRQTFHIPVSERPLAMKRKRKKKINRDANIDEKNEAP